MSKANTEVKFDNYDAIVLSYVKGESDNATSGVLKFDSFGEFDCYTVCPIDASTKVRDSSDMLNALNNKKNSISSCVSLVGLATGVRHVAQSYDTSKTDAVIQGVENEFWKLNTKYTLVSLVQFELSNKKMEEKLAFLEEILKSKQNAYPNISYCIYQSLDISDFFLFIKTNNFDEGRKLSFKFREEFKRNIFYSYTICGYNFEKLENEATPIKKFMICFTIENPGQYWKWRQEWGKNYPDTDTFKAYDRLGHEDKSFNVFKVTLGQLVNEIENGLLAKCDFEISQTGTAKGYVGAIMRPRIIIDSTEGKISNDLFEFADKPSSTIYTKHKDKIENESIGRHLLPGMKLALKNLFGAVGMLEHNSFAQDTVRCINASFDKFLDEWERSNLLIDEIAEEGEPAYSEQVDLHNRLWKYITANMSLIQGGLQTDSMFFQVPGFHISMFDAPSKLMLVYTSFINNLLYKVNEVETKLQEKKIVTSGAILNVGLKTNMSVEEIFDIDNENDFDSGTLLCINIPVSMLFLPKYLLPQIVHELGHYSILKCRNRINRSNTIVKLLSDIVSENFLDLSDEVSEQVGDTVKQKLRSAYKTLNLEVPDIYKELAHEIYIEFGNECCDLINEKFGSGQNEFYMSLTMLKETLYKVIDLFTSPLKTERICKILCDKLQALHSYNVQDMDAFLDALHSFTDIIYLNTGLKEKYRQYVVGILALMRESFADLFMVNACNLTKEEYIECVVYSMQEFIKSGSGSADKFLMTEYKFCRIMLVFRVAYNGENLLGHLESSSADNDKHLASALKKLVDNNSRLNKKLSEHIQPHLEKCHSDMVKDYNNINSGFAALAKSKTVAEFLKTFYALHGSFDRYPK